MSELDAIVGIYGAVDEAAQQDGDTRAAVAQLLPLYRDPDLHWFDDFQAWLKRTRGQAENPEPLFPGLGGALDELKEIRPKCRMRARRLFAIAVAARAYPEMQDPRSELGSLAVATLRVPTLAEKVGQARRLYELLVNDSLLMSADGITRHPLGAWWDHVIMTAHAEGLISDLKGLRPRPCSGRLVPVPDANGPVAALKTDFETDEIEFQAATKFLEPSNWQTCMPHFWCEMRETGVGTATGEHRYHEVVSSDCGRGKGAAFYAETELMFNFMWLPDRDHAEVALTNYQLSDDRPLRGDLIRIDEGTLVVAKVGPGQTPLRVITTKRVQFSNAFSTLAIAMIMCALGYADVSGDLLCCAGTLREDPEAGSEFPGEAPPAPRRAAGAAPRRAAKRSPRPRSTAAAAEIGELMETSARLWGRFLRDSASALERGAGSDRAGDRAGDRSED